MYPAWPEWGAEKPDAGPWQYWTSPEGAHHAGPVLDRVTALMPGVLQGAQVYTVIRCNPCIMIHVTPLPSQRTLDRYYAEHVYGVAHTDELERYTRDRPWWEMTHTAILTQARRHIHDERVRGGRFLEIGCGSGIALDVAQHLGLKTYGIEPNVGYAMRLQERHTVYGGTLGAALADTIFGASFPQQFDLIYLYEVLERQPNPEAFLLDCHDLLTPGGVLVVEVPNDYSVLQMAVRQQEGLAPWWLAPPEHLFHATPKTLQLLLRRCGFRLCDAWSTYPLERFLLEGFCYIGNDTLGRQCHTQRMTEELQAWQTGQWPAVLDSYREQLQEGLGRELLYIARKDDGRG